MEVLVSGMYKDYLILKKNGEVIHEGNVFILSEEDNQICLTFNEKEKYYLKKIISGIVIAFPFFESYINAPKINNYILYESEYKTLLDISYLDTKLELPDVIESEDLLYIWMVASGSSCCQIGDNRKKAVERFLKSIILIDVSDIQINKQLNQFLAGEIGNIEVKKIDATHKGKSVYLEIDNKLIEWKEAIVVEERVYFMICEGYYFTFS